MRNVIVYVGIILLTAYVEIMYVDFYGVTFIAFELLLFFSMFLLSWYLKGQVDVRLAVKIPAAGKKEEVSVRLKIRNGGVLPVTKLFFVVTAENSCMPKAVKIPVTASVSARGESEVSCTAAAEYCGRYHFRAVKGKISDYLGIFSRKIICREDAYVNVLPGFYSMEIKVSERTRNFAADGDTYDPHRSGDDPSEIFQIREFRDGDTLQRVHWKLSAKNEELMTKELGRPVGCSVLVLADLHMDKGEKNRPLKMDAFYELAAALSISLQQAGVRHMAAWFDEKQGEMCRVSIHGEEQVYEMTDRLLGAVPYEEEIDLLQLYQEEYPGELFASILQVRTEPALLVNGAEAAVFEPGHLEEQISGFLVEV